MWNVGKGMGGICPNNLKTVEITVYGKTLLQIQKFDFSFLNSERKHQRENVMF